jgi:hypothetical protein
VVCSPFDVWNHDCGRESGWMGNGCESVLKARASSGGVIIKSRMGYGEGVSQGY